MNKTQVTEVTPSNNSGSKFFYVRSLNFTSFKQIYFSELKNKVGKMDNFDDQVDSSSKSTGKFLKM